MKMSNILSNKKAKLGIIIGVVLLCILIIAIAVVRARNKNKDNPEQPVSTEIVLNDELKEKLSRYVYELSYGNYCDVPTNYVYDNDCLYRNNLTRKENVSISSRLNSLVLSMGSLLENNRMVGTFVVKGASLTNPYFVNLDDVEKEYHLIYGKDEQFFQDTINDINSSVKYDEKREKYFYTEKSSNNFVRTYIESFDKTENEVYVYVRVGYVTTENTYKYLVFADRNRTNQVAEMTRKELQEFNTVNASNYEKFGQYKFTFTREAETNNLVFSQVEKTI